MSEIPPPVPPEGQPSQPPQQYAEYNRGGQQPNLPAGGSAAKLLALSEGYFGLNLLFVANIVLNLAVNAIVRSTEFNLGSMLAGIAVIFLLVTLGSFPYNKKIGFGMDWSSSGAIIASLLMGLNSALCCGIIGFIVMQQIASSRIKAYGIKTGFFGLNKKVVAERVNQLRASEPPA